MQRFGMTRPYEHRVLTEVYLRDDDDEPVPAVVAAADRASSASSPTGRPSKRELAELPAEPAGDDFETWVVSLMGRHLYRLFIEGYTRKQWGCEPSELSSRFAPKRVDLRDDGYTRACSATRGSSSRPRARQRHRGGARARAGDVRRRPSRSTTSSTSSAGLTAVVITAPLDDFLGQPGALAWRGIHMVSRYMPTDDAGRHGDARLRRQPAVAPRAVHPHGRDEARDRASRSTAPSSARSTRVRRPATIPCRPSTSATSGATRSCRTRSADGWTGSRRSSAGACRPTRYIDQDQAIERALACADDMLDT